MAVEVDPNTVAIMPSIGEAQAAAISVTVRAVSGELLLDGFQTSPMESVSQLALAVEVALELDHEHRCQLVFGSQILVGSLSVKDSGLVEGSEVLAVVVIPPLPIAMLFPGSGSAFVGMLRDLHKRLPVVQEMCEKARDVLGYNILRFCTDGPESCLMQPQHCQPAMFLAGLASVEQLRSIKEEAVTRVQAMAGLEVGEYAALCAAEVFSFEDGLQLVALLGKLMQEEAAQGSPMLWIAGLDLEDVNTLCQRAALHAAGVCHVAKILFPRGYVCAGTTDAIMFLKELTEREGAFQSNLLQSAGAFNTPLMLPAARELQTALEEVLPRMRPPRCDVYMSCTASCVGPNTRPEEIAGLLVQQLVSPIQWEPVVRAMVADGITEFHASMKQLRAIMKRIDPEVWHATKVIHI